MLGLSLSKGDLVLMKRNPGYHLNPIPKGIYGDFSKIIEEFLELQDSVEQHNKIMTLNEISDLYGAINGFLEKNYTGISMWDIADMSKVTSRSFKSGERK